MSLYVKHGYGSEEGKIKLISNQVRAIFSFTGPSAFTGHSHRLALKLENSDTLKKSFRLLDIKSCRMFSEPQWTEMDKVRGRQLVNHGRDPDLAKQFSGLNSVQGK